MSRTARIVSGAVLAGVLLFVAVVAGVIAAASSADGVGDALFGPTAPVDSDAEILDIDSDPFLGGAPYVDVSFVDEDGEVVVTFLEWFGDGDPQLGERMAIVYDGTDPEFAWDARDPVVGGEEPSTEDESGLIPRAAGWTAAGALVAALLAAALTVPWALAKPAKSRQQPSPTWYPPTSGYPPTTSYPPTVGYPQGPPPMPVTPGPYPAAASPPQSGPPAGYAPADPPPPPVWNTPS